MFEMKEEGQKKIRDVIEDIKTCMFTTTDEICNVYSRPMFTVKVDNESCLWFFTSEQPGSEWEINPEKQVTLVYSHPGKNSYMNVYGSCTLVHDKEKMKELWNPALKAWFPEGAEAPDVCLIRVCIDEAFYWDNSTNDMVCVYRSEGHNGLSRRREESLFVPQPSNW